MVNELKEGKERMKNYKKIAILYRNFLNDKFSLEDKVNLHNILESANTFDIKGISIASQSNNEQLIFFGKIYGYDFSVTIKADFVDDLSIKSFVMNTVEGNHTKTSVQEDLVKHFSKFLFLEG